MDYSRDYNDAECYIKTDLICWASYPVQPDGRAFSVYPLYAVKNGQYERVDEASFPDDGAFTAMPSNRWSTVGMDEIEERYGSIVVANVATSFNPNNGYGSAGISDRLLVFFDPDMRGSQLRITSLASSSISNGLYQVFRVPDSVSLDFSRPFKKPIRLAEEAGELCCSRIFLKVQTAHGPEHYGPFMYQADQQGRLRISAIDALDYRVYRISSIPAAERVTLNRGAAGGHAQIASFLRRGYIDARGCGQFLGPA